MSGDGAARCKRSLLGLDRHEDPYVEAAAIQVPQPPGAAAPAQRAQVHLAEGARVDYYSRTQSSWIPAVVTKVDGERGAVKLDVKRSWMSLRSHGSLLRPRTRPGKEHMREVLDIFRSGSLVDETRPIFMRHAQQIVVAPRREENERERIGQGEVKFGVLLEDIAALADDVDAWLGISCSQPALRACFGPLRQVLLMEAFQEVCWSLLWWLNAEYRHALAKKETIERSRRNMGEVLDIIKVLGEGSFGRVVLALDRQCGEKRAVKVIGKAPNRASEEEEQELRLHLAREMEHLQMLDHPHVVRLFEYFEDKNAWYLVMEYCTGGELSDVVRRAQSFSIREHLPFEFIGQVMHQVLRGIAHVHSRGLLHLDLKSQNIMLMPSETAAPTRTKKQATIPGFAELLERPHAMIIDLGVSQVFQPGQLRTDRACGTPATMAPEVWCKLISPKADIFSLGVVLFELFALELPFLQVPFDSKAAQDFWELKPGVPFQKMRKAPEDALRLTTLMLQLDRKRRPNAKQCLLDPFFKAFQEEMVMSVEGSSYRFPTFSAPDVDAATVPALPDHFAKRLANYGNRSMMEKAVRIKLARTWAPNQNLSIKRLFTALDISGMGRLDTRIVCKSLRLTGVLDGDARATVDSLVLSADGLIGWTEFVAALVDLGEARYDAFLKQVFDEADENRDGLLCPKDFAYILSVNDDDDANLVSEIALEICGRADDTAKIDWNGFRRYFKTKAGEEDPNAPVPATSMEHDHKGRKKAGYAVVREEGPTVMEQVQNLFEWFGPSEEIDEKKLEPNLRILRQMGFDRQQCIAALKKHRNVLGPEVIQELV